MKRTAGRVDLWVPVVGAVALAVYALHGVQGELTRDLGIYAYAGQQFAEGVPPYVGVVNRAGPLAHALPGVAALVARAAGLEDVSTMRVLFMFVAVACVCAAYVVGRSLFRSRVAGLVSAATLLSFHGFVQYASNGPREKTPMTLFVIGVIWAITRRRWFTAGVFVSLATLCLQIAFAPTVTASLVGAAVLSGQGERMRAVARVLAGGASPAALYLLYAALVGALSETLDGFLLLNLRYTAADPLSQRFDEAWEALQPAYGASLWVLVVGVVAVLVLAPFAVVRGHRTARPWLPDLAVLATGVVAGLAWTWREYDAWPDLFPLLPFAALGVAALFRLLAEAVPIIGGLVVAATLCLALVATAVGYSVTTRSDVLRDQQRSVDAVLGALPEDVAMLSIEAPQPLVLSRGTNPTRHQMFSNNLWRHVDDTWPGGLDGYRQWVADDGPPLVALVDAATPAWRQALATDYELVGTAPGWLWYARRSLGQDTLSQLRAVATEASG